jgi:hypothetical protein
MRPKDCEQEQMMFKVHKKEQMVSTVHEYE